MKMTAIIIQSSILFLLMISLDAIVFSEKDLKTICKLSSELELSGLDDYDTAGIMEETIEENYGPPSIKRGLSNDQSDEKINLDTTEELMVRQLITELTDSNPRGNGYGSVNNYYQGATIVKIITKIMQKKGSMSVINNNVATQNGTVQSQGVEVSNSLNKNMKGYQKMVQMQVTGSGMRIDVPNYSRSLNSTLFRNIANQTASINEKVKNSLQSAVSNIGNHPNVPNVKRSMPKSGSNLLPASIGNGKPHPMAITSGGNIRKKRNLSDKNESINICDELIFPSKMDSSNHEAWFEGLLTISDQILTLRKIHDRPNEIVRHITGAVLEERNGKVFPKLQGVRFGV